MQKTILLNNGNTIPVLGLGTWESEKNQAGDAVTYAIKSAGYRHIDCAHAYGNEQEIGRAFSGIIGTLVKREELFVTSKLWNTDHAPQHVEKACTLSLSNLGISYLDLYLMHWGISFTGGTNSTPKGKDGRVTLEKVSVRETWLAMEKLVGKGLVKSIGVANFSVPMLIDLLTYATILPAVNQVELHPYNTQTELVDFCHRNTIAVTAYSPLGRQGVKTNGPKLVDETIVQSLSQKYHKTPSQVLLCWAIQRGTIVIPKSVTPSRISENIDVSGVVLTQHEMDQLTSLNKNYRFVNPADAWGIPYFS